MRPTLEPGQNVVVRATHRFRAGDVALIEIGADGYVLHRLLVVSRFGPVIHAGDAPFALASLTHARRLVGRAEIPKQRVSLWHRLRATGQALATFRYRDLFRA
jgi:hypothetical protein